MAGRTALAAAAAAAAAAHGSLGLASPWLLHPPLPTLQALRGCICLLCCLRLPCPPTPMHPASAAGGWASCAATFMSVA